MTEPLRVVSEVLPLLLAGFSKISQEGEGALKGLRGKRNEVGCGLAFEEGGVGWGDRRAQPS